MLNKNAKKWVKALRSGKYKQCKNRLTHAGRFCCLGVAADISGIPREEWSRERALPDAVMHWLGLKDGSGNLGGAPFGSSLANMNDYEGKTFEQIAAFIESEPEGLFVQGGEA